MRIKLIILVLLGIMATTTHAQVLWDFRAIGSYQKSDNTDKKNIFNWGAELGIDIPVKEKFGIEVALRYKNWLHSDSYEHTTDLDPYNKVYWETDKWEGQANLLELPIRFSYKLPVSSNSLVRIGVGPYVSVGMDHSFSVYQAGVTTAVTYEYRKINVGLNYDFAVHKGFDNELSNELYLTVGVKFKSSAWKKIGTAAAVIGGAAVAVGTVVTAANGDDVDEASFVQSTDLSVDETSTETRKSSGNKSKLKQLEKSNSYMSSGSYRNDNRAYTGFEDQLRDMKLNPEKYDNLSSSQFRSKVKNIQSKMKTIRERIVKNGGTKAKSSFESWNP